MAVSDKSFLKQINLEFNFFKLNFKFTSRKTVFCLSLILDLETITDFYLKKGVMSCIDCL
jgi:hypothetical protein